MCRQMVYNIISLKGGMFMHTPYETAFKYEISNEIIASIRGFISRNYKYPYEENAPMEIVDLRNEVGEIYRALPLENDFDKQVEYQDRLCKIMKRVKEITPQPHK